ncbi:MAG TPA: glutamyl-tRNA reductase [Gemmataceae bacterium]|nr:glutamyl-tRNA reductase [Gemmataceae bacterium]
MILLAIGCSYKTTPVEVRERLAFKDEHLSRAHTELCAGFDCEAVILSTCNRVELYAGFVLDDGGALTQPRSPSPRELDAEFIAEFFADFHNLPVSAVRPHLYVHYQAEAVRHLFRVAASLDSMIVGEGQIAGQVKKAYEQAVHDDSVGPLLHNLFRHARRVARRVRTETGIAHGHVSVSSAAVDYVKQVFDHFGDKTILVIGAGKMGELTLKHLRQLKPRHIWVTNRSADKAQSVAKGCGGEAMPWQRLDDLLARTDIVLSTTGAAEPIVTRQRYEQIAARRTGGPLVILDIAVPRDFDPSIHDGDRTCLFNIDDLKRIREATLADRFKHVEPAEAIVQQETNAFLKDWARRRHGPVIARLTQDFESKRREIVGELLSKLNGRLTDADRRHIEGAFRLLLNRLLHGPITALTEEPHSDGGGHTLLDALRKLFRLKE